MSTINCYKNLNDFKTARSTWSDDLGFVPTMGNLHKGHLNLIENSLRNHPLTLVSIFVNPLQFGPHEDFDCYPRTLQKDLELIENLKSAYQDKTVAIFAPADANEIYPSNFSTTISLGPLTQELEGKVRPTHFDGVTTVVYRLLQITRPRVLYMGKKDFQQLTLIQKMVHDLELPVQVQGLETVREDCGLALSSRNQYLDNEQKELALNLSKALKHVQQLYQNSEPIVLEDIKKKFSAPHTKWEYLELRNLDLTVPAEIKGELIALGAMKVGSTHLIDNLELGQL